MGLFLTDEKTSTGNSIMVGDMMITWDDNEDAESKPEPCCVLPADKNT